MAATDARIAEAMETLARLTGVNGVGIGQGGDGTINIHVTLGNGRRYRAAATKDIEVAIADIRAKAGV